MEAWKDETATDPMLHELKLAINKSHKTKKLGKKTVVTVDVIKRSLENLGQAELSEIKNKFMEASNMSTRMSILARVIYGDPLANVDRKVAVLQKSVRSAELNALLLYAKHYEGKMSSSGDTLPQVMNRILNEKITGKKEDDGEDSARP